MISPSLRVSRLISPLTSGGATLFRVVSPRLARAARARAEVWPVHLVPLVGADVLSQLVTLTDEVHDQDHGEESRRADKLWKEENYVEMLQMQIFEIIMIYSKSLFL